MTPIDNEAVRQALRGGITSTVLLAKTLEASDIHLSPLESAHEVRFRIHGFLTEPVQISHETGRTLVQAFKAACKMNIAEQRKPQDGRLSIAGLESRLAIHPSLHGENLVIRLLGVHGALTLNELGIPDDARHLLIQMSRHADGLVLVAGATGSGKTTTLHALLNHLGRCAGRITTLEDPVEIINPNALQTDLSRLTHLNFSSGLRSLMRQDPDTILVGEIRDEETAELTLQAALTGHRVFASVHAPDCIGALCRLIELQIRWGSLLNCLNGIIAQRLVPQIDRPHAQQLEVELMYPRTLPRASLMGCMNIESLLKLQQSESFIPFKQTTSNHV